MHYAKTAAAREKIEQELSSAFATVKLERDALKECGVSAARFELRGDKEWQDADYITWQCGAVLKIPPGLDDAAVDAVIRAYQQGYEAGECGGKGELQREFRSLLGLEG